MSRQEVHDPRYQGKRGLWDDRQLKLAVSAVLMYGISKKQAAKNYGIPRPTLIRHVTKAQQGQGVQKRLGRSQLLSEDEEMELCRPMMIQDMESRLRGLTEFDVKKFVYNYCNKKSIEHSFNEEDKAAGRVTRVWMRVSGSERNRALQTTSRLVVHVDRDSVMTSPAANGRSANSVHVGFITPVRGYLKSYSVLLFASAVPTAFNHCLIKLMRIRPAYIH